MHLKETYIKSIEAASEYDCEFILLNYNSKDDLDQWVNDTLGLLMEQGKVKYYTTKEPKYFNMSHAKNVAHLLASKELICNLDADNTLTKDYMEYVFSVFRKNKNQITYGTSNAGGRNCIHRDNFYKLNGYDEELIGCARDDRDFRMRAAMLGIHSKKHQSPNCNVFIQHTDDLRVAHYDPQETRKMLNQKYEEEFVLENEEELSIRHKHVFNSVKYNSWKTWKNLQEQKFKANVGKEWGQAKVFGLDGKEFYVTRAG